MNLEHVNGSWEAMRKAIRAEELAAYDDSVRAHEALVAIHKREALIDQAVRTVVFERRKVTNDPVYKTDWFMIADLYRSDIWEEMVRLSRIPHVSHTAPHYDAYRTPSVRMVNDSINIPQPPSHP